MKFIPRGLLLVALLVPASLKAQDAPTVIAPNTLLPIDPEVRIGTLDNGVTYYVRRNVEPAKRAEMRLAINAGSLLEDDDQRGLAHFLEHMLFNGTRRFEKQALVSYLESTGMRFGGDVNAYTSFDETVYMLTIPTDSAEIFSKAFEVLEDWAGYATLADEEIEKERGVIIEEWRARQQNAQGRIMERTLPVLLHGSRYADRLPIGDTSIVRNAPAEKLRSFYGDWYRPDLIAVSIVGDVDVDKTEQLIREHFSSLQPATSPRPREEYEVPGHQETLYRVVADREFPATFVEVLFKQPAEEAKTVGDFRENLLFSLFNGMMNARLDEIEQQANAPFLSSSVYRGGFARPTEFYSLQARVADGGIERGLEALQREVERVRQHGFTASELDRQKAEIQRAYARRYAERERTNSAQFANQYVAHYLSGAPIPGIAYENRLVQELLPTVTVEEVNAVVQSLLSEENRAVLVRMTDRPDEEEMTDAALEALHRGVVARVASETITPYEDTVSGEALLSQIPAPAAVVGTNEIQELGVTEITLANGVKVVMKPTAFKNDEVVFTASSHGGSSLLSDDAVYAASVAGSVAAQSGVGSFSRSDLEKMLAGKVANVNPYIGELSEGLNGNASPQDLETLFQLIHLYFTAPRIDENALAAFQNSQRAFLANRSATPIAAFQDTLQAALYGNHPRRQPPSIEQVDALRAEELMRIYRDRFGNAGDFTFTFVGAFDVPTLTTLARTYLGTLPSSASEETWRDVYPRMPAQIVTRNVYKGVAPQSQVAIIFHTPFEFTPENRQVLSTMAEILSIKLREDIREERGGVYGIQAQASPSDRPVEQQQTVVFFSTDPNRVDELVEAVFEQVRLLQEDGPTEEDLSKVREQQRRARQTALETNPFWLGTLNRYKMQDREDVRDVLRYDQLVQGVTAQQVQEAARQWLRSDRYVRVALYPESMGQTE